MAFALKDMSEFFLDIKEVFHTHFQHTFCDSLLHEFYIGLVQRIGTLRVD